VTDPEDIVSIDKDQWVSCFSIKLLASFILKHDNVLKWHKFYNSVKIHHKIDCLTIKTTYMLRVS